MLQGPGRRLEGAIHTVTIDGPTLISYTAVLMAVIGGLFTFFWSREERSVSLLWFCLPFLLALAGAAITANPTLRPGEWGPRIGTAFLVLAYGFGWQMVRVFYGRRPLLLPMFAAVAVWFVLSATVLKDAGVHLLNASIRISLIAAFTGLAAREFWRSREKEDLPSRAILFWVFAAYSAFHVVRVPTMSFVPMPIGMAPTTVWAVIAYNLAAVVLVLFVSIFMIALSRERQAARNYSLALRDAMTGVYNRRAYYEHMQAFQASGDPPRPYALLEFDIDRFKTINDRFGHQAGDKVIIAAAHAAVATLRKQDRVFRMGGEEFVCLLPGAGPQEAYRAAERVRLAFQKIAAVVDGEQVDATISLGVATTDGEASFDQVFARADIALYEAKQAGRNRTVTAGLAAAAAQG